MRLNFTSALVVTRKFQEFTRRWRNAFLLLGAVLFIAGGWYSLGKLELSIASLQLPYLALLALAGVPISLMYGALNMVLSARTAGARIGFSKCFRVNSYAQLAEVLPVPGGAIVRGSALVSEGVAVGRSASIILATSLLWMACAAVAAGLALADIGGEGFILAAAGAVLIGILLIYIARISSWQIAALNLLMRLVGILIAAIRLSLAFSVLAIDLPFQQTFIYAFASISGSAASIAPAGLGISEWLAALLALATDTAPAEAFIGVGLNRLVGIAVVALVCLIIALFGKQEQRA